jgi:Flp pilus assembly pilin Flp
VILYALEMVRHLTGRLVKDERGQDLIEYALLGGLIAVAIMGAVAFLSGALSSMFTGIGNCIDFNSGTTCAPF